MFQMPFLVEKKWPWLGHKAIKCSLYPVQSINEEKKLITWIDEFFFLPEHRLFCHG